MVGLRLGLTANSNPLSPSHLWPSCRIILCKPCTTKSIKLSSWRRRREYERQTGLSGLRHCVVRRQRSVTDCANPACDLLTGGVNCEMPVVARKSCGVDALVAHPV